MSTSRPGGAGKSAGVADRCPTSIANGASGIAIATSAERDNADWSIESRSKGERKTTLSTRALLGTNRALVWNPAGERVVAIAPSLRHVRLSFTIPFMAFRADLRRGARFAALALAIPFATARAQPAATGDAEIRNVLALRVMSGRNPAIVVGIYENGQTRIIPMGASDAPNKALDGNTVFEIGSITKVFTSTLLADMVARGLVALDDPVGKYLPSTVRMPSRDGRVITLVDLATQHSGLPRMPDNLTPADPGNPYADYTAAHMFEFLSRYQLPRDPGESFEYSNLGVGLLGDALSRRAGTSYEALVTDRILGPLGMRSTTITLTPELREHLAQAYDATGHRTKNWDIPALAGAGALRSTANDMLRFAAAALGAPGTPPGVAAALAEAERPRRELPGDGKTKIGLNWFTAQAGPVEIVWHNGGTGGYRSFLGLDKSASTGGHRIHEFDYER